MPSRKIPSRKFQPRPAKSKSAASNASTPSNPSASTSNDPALAAITPAMVKEAGLLGMNRIDAAISLTLTDEQFARLLGSPVMMKAYLDGRAKLRQQLHAQRIKSAMDGNQTAITEALKRLDREDERVIASPDDQIPQSEPGGIAGPGGKRSRRGIPKIENFADEYQRMIRERKSAG